MLEIRQLAKKDYDKAIQFAIKGMHFDSYTPSKVLQNLYGRYFLYMELNRASHVLAAYDGDELMGLLLADVKGVPKTYRSTWQSIYANTVDWLLKTFVADATGRYDAVNTKMLADYQQKFKPDGEIIFLAANPDSKIRGIGIQLLQAFEKEVQNKEIYLYTDSNCTYQFYEKRGFERAGTAEINMTLNKNQVPLTCFLYRKQVG